MTTEVALFSERILQKDKELAELQTSYNKFRLKTKVKLDQLKQQVTQYCNDHQIACSEEDNPALLRVLLVEAETTLADAKLENERMAAELVRRQMHINDHNILIRSLEDRLLKEISTNEKNISDRRRAAQQLDLERIHQQMLYKDERIVELNNVILDRERQILDLQETCREQGEVATVKNQAMRIVQRKFEEIESKTKREVGTETDPYLSQGGQSNHWETPRSSRGTSPGRLISARVPAGTHNGQHSPPPLDPMEGQKLKDTMYDMSEAGPSSSFEDDVNGKRGRKRVTFDLPPSAASSSLTLNMPVIDNDSEIKDLMSENSKLHDLLKEKDIIIAQQKTEIDQVDENMSRATREGKNASLKARAVAQARIRELEEKMAEQNKTYSVQIEHLEGQVDTLRATREWEVEQNGTLREQISELKNKNYKLNEELDASEKSRRELENKSEETQKLLDQLVEELSDAEAIVVHLEDQKISILDDVDRLKEAIEAQEQLIEVLEADIVIYEEHIGILRESLGASKVDHRSLIRSKAFETKLRALEQEKEQINRKSREDRLRYKALAQKVKLLEEENEKLTAEICEREMGVSEDQEIMEACRQLEAKIQQSETQLASEKSKYETEIEQIRLEKEAQLKQALEELNYYREREEATKYQQTVIEQQNIVQAHEEREELERQIENFRYQLNQKCHLSETLQNQLDGLLGQNFELQEKVQEMTNSVNAYDILVERHREVARDAVELREEKVRLEREVATVIISHEEQRSRSNSAQYEYHSLKKALKEAAEKNEVKDKQIGELIEKIRQLSTQEHAAVVDQSPIADSQELQDLRILLHEAKEKIETDKQEKKKLKLAVKKLLDEKSRTENVPSHIEEQVQRVTVAETQQAAPARGNRALSEETEEKIKNLELECRLSGELNVEMGRAMLELEQQSDSDYARITTLNREVEKTSAELKLKEMMYAEVTSELELARATEQEMQRELIVEAEHQMAENKEETIEELKSQLERLQKNFEDSRSLNSEHAAQIGRLQADLYSKQDDLNAERVRVEAESQRQYEQNMNELREEIRSLESERETIIASSQGYQIEIEQLKQKLDNMVQQLEYGRNAEMSQTSHAEQIINEVRAKIEHLQGEQDRSTAVIAGYEGQINNLQTLLHQHEQELQMERSSRMEAETNLANAHLSMQLLRSSFTETTDRVAAAQHTEQGQDLSLLQATVATVEAVVEQNSPRIREQQPTIPETPIMPPESTLESENIILRQVVHQSQQMQDDVYQDVAKLLELKNELETAVDALKGEIWSLNGQLKASVLDRENLQDQLVELDTALSAEKTRADGLDRELSEQVELTEKAARQAAEAENESNRRLAECLDMEGRREQLEKSYAQLTDYYNQLQAAYNMLYAQVNAVENNATTSEESQKRSESVISVSNYEAELLIASILSDLQLDPANAGESLQEKLNLIQVTIKDRLNEIDQSRTALMDQRRATAALEERLTSLEEETETNGVEVLRTKERLLQVEGDLEWKEDECVSLKRRVEELQAALDSIVTRDADEVCATTRLQTELAILAARLATRQADVDSLFRTNAELAHTNVRLQNELDDSQQEQLELTRNQEQTQVQKMKLDPETEVLKALLDEKTEELDMVRAEVDSLSSAKKDLEDKIDAMESEMYEKSETLEALQTKLRGLQSTIDSRRSSLKSESPQPPERTESQNLVERLQDEIFKLKKHLESVQTQLSTAVVNLDAAEHTADAVRQELSSVKSELLTLSEHSQKESTVEQESEWGWGVEEPKNTAQNEESTAILSKQLEEVQSAHQDLIAEHETLKATHEELRNNNEKLTEVNEDLKDVEEDLDRYKKLLKKAKEDEKELRKQLEEQKQAAVDKEPAASQDDSNWGWGEQQEFKADESENQNLVSELTEKVQNLQQQYDDLLSKYDNLAVSNSALKDENLKLSKATDVLEAMEAEMVRLKEQQETTLELQNKLQEQLDTQKTAILEKESAQQDEPEWEWDEEESKKKESNEGHVQELTEKIESLQQELDKINSKYRDLEEKCITLESENESMTELKCSLHDVEKDLQRYKELLRLAQEKEQELTDKLENRTEAAALCSMEPVKQQASSEAWNQDAGWDDDNWGTENEVKDEAAVPEEPTPNLSAALENLQSLYDDLSKDYSNLSYAHNQLTVQKQLLEGKIEKQEQLIDELEENEEKLRIAEEKQKELEEAIARSQEQKKTEQKNEEPASAWTDDNNWGEDNWGDDQETQEASHGSEKIEEQSCSNEELVRLTGEVTRYSELVDRLEAQCEAALEQGQISEEEVRKLRQQQQEITEENERLQNEITAVESRYTSLTEELEAAQTVNSKLETQLVDQDNSSKLEETLNELESMRANLTSMKRRMKELEQQNELLKDSECRLLDSADEFGEQAEKEANRANSLQKVVNELEEKLMKLEEKLEQQLAESQEEKTRLESEIKILEKALETSSKVTIEQPTTSTASDAEPKRVSAENNRLLEELNIMKEKLAAVEQERTKIKTAYDQLRARLVARRAAATASRDISRLSSIATENSEIPEEEPVPSVPVTVSVNYVDPPSSFGHSQATDASVSRRRCALPKK